MATLSDDAQKKFLSLISADGSFGINDTAPAGFTLRYDDLNAVLILYVTPTSLAKEDLSLQDDGNPTEQKPIPLAKLSGFVNFRGSQDYIYQNMNGRNRQPALLDMDGAINLKGWVLEGEGHYQEDTVKPWMRDDLRIVHDWPDKMVRVALGDLSYPVTSFQSYQPIFGISIARNFSLQPYKVTEPTGQSSFILQSFSRVDVIVNGQRIRTLDLAPGPYDVSDFPIVDGSNDVKLIITDATGHTEEKTFSIFGDQQLLKAGLHEYSYNLGIKSNRKNQRIEYEESKPAFSGFHRYGVTNSLTAGLSLQADTDVQQVGVSTLSTHKWGTLGFESSLSHAKNAAVDTALRLSYDLQDPTEHRKFSTSFEYSGADFIALGDDQPYNPDAWEMAARYNQVLPFDIDMGIGGRYSFGRKEDDQWSYSANFSRSLSDTLSLNVNWEHRNIEGVGVFVGLTWTPLNAKFNASSTVDTMTHTKDVKMDWHQGRRWNMDAGLTQDDDSVQGVGSVNYAGQRLELGLRHDVNRFQSPSEPVANFNPIQQRTQIQAATALAFADGHFALSSPIDDGFVLLARHKNLKNHDIGVNIASDDNEDIAYEAEIDSKGPSVIPDAVPYIYRPIKVDTRTLPLGYDIGQDDFVSLPSYKSGALVMIGSAANIYIDGYIASPDKAPLKLQGGIITNIDDKTFPEQEFFTNENGRFQVSRLQPGTYELTLDEYPENAAFLTIPEDSPVGRFDAGTLILKENKP